MVKLGTDILVDVQCANLGDKGALEGILSEEFLAD